MEPAEKVFFQLLHKDANIAEQDAKADANLVHGFDSHKSAGMLWLRRTGISENARELKKGEIRASLALPKNR